jgi:hypothetical protein
MRGVPGRCKRVRAAGGEALPARHTRTQKRAPCARAATQARGRTSGTQRARARVALCTTPGCPAPRSLARRGEQSAPEAHVQSGRRGCAEQPQSPASRA